MKAGNLIRRKWFVTTLFIVALCVRGQAFGQEYKVSITPKAEYRETRYTLTAGDQKEVSLVTYNTELNRGVLRLRSESGAPLNEQIEMLSHLFQTVLQKEPHKKFETLFIGGLLGAFGSHNQQMSLRLALAAHDSALWNNQKGGAAYGHENDVVIKLSNQYSIYTELGNMFALHGYAIRISGVEKVFISRADKLPMADVLKAEGVKPSDRLPYDCLTWFALSAPGEAGN